MFGQVVSTVVTELIKTQAAQEIAKNLIAEIGNETVRGASSWIASVAQTSRFGPQVVGELASQAVVSLVETFQD